MGKVITTRDVCIRLQIPRYRLQYLFDTRKIQDVERTSTGDRIYTEDDIKRIREALFNMM